MLQKKLTLVFMLCGLLFLAACQPLAVPVGVVATPVGATPVLVIPTAVELPTSELPTAEPTEAIPTVPVPVIESPTAPPPTAASPAQPTAVIVADTTVQYIVTLGDVNIRSGPGTGYQIVSALRQGATATVVGISSDSGWWKIQCPANIIGSCWVTANNQFTRSTTSPVVATPIPAACVDAATFVADVSVPDDTHYLPNTSFTKTWRVKNSGTCTWDKAYAIAFKDGHRLGSGYDAYALTGTIAPNGTVDIGIKMQAPAAPGVYQGNWQLRNPKGVRFGVGRSNVPLWTKIIVDPPTSVIGTIGGLAWQDHNLNGLLEGNETLASKRILLFTGANCTQFVASAQTDNAGRYVFGSLNTGSYCVVGLDGETNMSQVNVALGANQNLTNIHLQWPAAGSQTGTINGRVYQDKNGNDIFDSGDVTVGAGREIWLQRNGCDNAGSLLVQAITRDDGRYTFNQIDTGTYCVGLRSNNGLEDVVTLNLPAGQTVDNINLRTAPASSIAGWFWIDNCFIRTDGTGSTVVDGNCLIDGYGGYYGNGLYDAGEVGLGGVTIKIQKGFCATDNPSILATAVTDSSGQFMFRDLDAGTYCVLMNAAEGGNAALLLPGDWTYPARGIWYNQVTVYAGEQRTGVNFAWDYQLK